MGYISFNPFTPKPVESINVALIMTSKSAHETEPCVTIQMKAIQQYFQVVLFVFAQFFKIKFKIFYTVLNLALLGVEGLTLKYALFCLFCLSSYPRWLREPPERTLRFSLRRLGSDVAMICIRV